ncbi:MAG: copper-translocating P-type ATPase [Anaerolineales bacterium]|nr:copper-translocating P-type ATPase [Anaerolineales bacterium]
MQHHSNHNEEPMEDHSQHNMDHSMHEGMDHSEHAGHSMPATTRDHSAQTGHNMSGAMDHSAHAGHGTDHGGHEQMFRIRFWWSLLLSIPVLLYSEMIQHWLNFYPPVFPFSEWVPFILSLAIFAYGGIPFLQMAVPELKERKPGMMTLISLAISVAFIYSVAAEFVDLGEGFFWELVTLIDIMLLGHWLEMRSVRQASGALNELAKLMPDTAERVIKGSTTETVSVSDLQHGDLILIRPGTSVSADGEVVGGFSDVSEAMITGESKPVHKHKGEKVIAGTINGDGSLRVKVTATGNETALAGIMRLVEQAQQSKSKTQVLADKAAGWLFYIALASAILTAIAWTIADTFNIEVLNRVVTVLVIACPHALGLAVPLVVAITTAMGAKNGILVRNRLALEAAREIDVVIFDKTGTLTQGQFGVVDTVTADGWDSAQALALAASLETDSEHLIAQSIRRFARDRKMTLPAITNFSALQGRGVQAEFENETYYVGGPRLLEMLGLTPMGAFKTFTDTANTDAQSVVYLTTKDRIIAGISIADVIRLESKKAVDELKAMGIEVAMLTGDSYSVASAVANQLGINRVFAEVLPEHKDQKVMELQKLGKRVAMVGDGVNDAPALTRADVGIAIGGGTDVAIESAGLILVNSNPLDVVKIFKLSRASYRKMIQNLWWAAGYNIIAIPLAAGVLANWGVTLSPAVGAVLMSISTIVVAINAQLLRRVTL